MGKSKYDSSRKKKGETGGKGRERRVTPHQQFLDPPLALWLRPGRADGERREIDGETHSSEMGSNRTSHRADVTCVLFTRPGPTPRVRDQHRTSPPDHSGRRAATPPARARPIPSHNRRSIVRIRSIYPPPPAGVSFGCLIQQQRIIILFFSRPHPTPHLNTTSQ